MRALGLTLGFLLFAGAAYAQVADGEAYFRLGTNLGADGSVGGPSEPVDPGTEFPEGDLKYPLATPAYGGSVTVSPQLPAGVVATGYEWNQPEIPPGATINETTGAITWNAEFRGDMTVAVYAHTEDGEGVTGYASARVPTEYTIATTPSSYTVQYGKEGVIQQIVASTNPPQPTEGEEWEVHYSGLNMEPLEHVENRLIFDSSARLADYLDWPGEYRFRFSRTADGETTYGPFVNFTLTHGPHFSYPLGQAPNYRVAGYENDPGSIIQVIQGVPVSIPATPQNGAFRVATSWPAHLNYQLNGYPLPPGLTMEPDGDIVGTPSGPTGVMYNGLRVPTVDATGTVYGHTYLTFFVVPSFMGDDEVWDQEYPDPNEPLPPEEPGEGDPEVPAGPTYYAVVRADIPAEMSGFRYDGIKASTGSIGRYPYIELYRGTDEEAAQAIFDDLEAANVTYAIQILDTTQPELPYEEWREGESENGFKGFVWQTAWSCAGPWTAGSSFATLEHLEDYDDWQRELSGGTTTKYTGLFEKDPVTSNLTMLLCHR